MSHQTMPATRTIDLVPVRPPWLQRIGVACARRPLVAVGVWIAILLIVLAASRGAGGTYRDNLSLNGTEANTGLTLLRTSDPGAAGYSGLVVMHTDKGAITAQSSAVQESVADLAQLPHVLSATDPLSTNPPTVSSNGQTAYSTLHLDVSPKTLDSGYVTQLDTATASLRHAGVEVEYGGDFDQLTRPKADDKKSELIGFAVALVVLLVGFGSVAGAVLPLLTALFSVLVGLGLLSLVAGVLAFGTASPTLALMIGLGVGIDYAVFLTTRFRQMIADGFDPVQAAGTTVATSGHAVLVAASTVAVALFGLYASGMTFIGQLGFAAVFGVLTAAAGALSLVPAGLALVGRRIDRMAVRAPVAESGSDRDVWHRYAAWVGRRPWPFFAAGMLLLAVLAIPLLSIRLGHVDDGADPTSYTDKRAYDLVASGFGPGANGPLTIVVSLGSSSGSATTLAQAVQSDLAATPGVAHASPLAQTSDGKLLTGTVVPTTSPQARATTNLVHHLGDITLPDALRGSHATGYVTGSTATYVQFTDALTHRLMIIIGVVVATAFLLIMATFRSLLLAVKAAVLNLLSIAAAYGVVVAVFQWGWGRGLLGVSENVPIESYVPVLLFAIVFGLSMDYEIFLLSRVKETWDATHDHPKSVATGLAGTARVITCAALIMASVFTAFVGSNDVVIKMLALGLAASVVIDATIVRLLLVPAIVNLLGPASWWLPHWVDRILPHIEAEGAGPGPTSPVSRPAVSPAGTPAAAGQTA